MTQTQKLPTVAIFVHQGCVSSVESEVPLNVMVLDGDFVKSETDSEFAGPLVRYRADDDVWMLASTEFNVRPDLTGLIVPLNRQVVRFTFGVGETGPCSDGDGGGYYLTSIPRALKAGQAVPDAEDILQAQKHLLDELEAQGHRLGEQIAFVVPMGNEPVPADEVQGDATLLWPDA